MYRLMSYRILFQENISDWVSEKFFVDQLNKPALITYHPRAFVIFLLQRHVHVYMKAESKNRTVLRETCRSSQRICTIKCTIFSWKFYSIYEEE